HASRVDQHFAVILPLHIGYRLGAAGACLPFHEDTEGLLAKGGLDDLTGVQGAGDPLALFEGGGIALYLSVVALQTFLEEHLGVRVGQRCRLFEDLLRCLLLFRRGLLTLAIEDGEDQAYDQAQEHATHEPSTATRAPAQNMDLNCLADAVNCDSARET